MGTCHVCLDNSCLIVYNVKSTRARKHSARFLLSTPLIQGPGRRALGVAQTSDLVTTSKQLIESAMEDSYELNAGDSGDIVEELDESIGRVQFDVHISVFISLIEVHKRLLSTV